VSPLKEAGRLKGSANQQKQLKLTAVLAVMTKHERVIQLHYTRTKAQSVPVRR